MIASCKPIVKWAGGKRQLISQLKDKLPPEFGNYFEPFVGGGAMFFNLNRGEGHINDFNSELINVYLVVKNQPKELIKSLKSHRNESEYYYKLRGQDRESDFAKLSDVTKASRFIFLNKTGFNGLCRVNKQGYNNVPFGYYKNPSIVDEENIMACSKLLQKTTITHGDFENIKDKIKQGDFIYFDPPYLPISKTSGFTSYTSSGFSSEQQERLRDFCDYINSIGAYFMLSNSTAQKVKELYKKYNITEVLATRAINCKATGRGKIKELIITNYQPPRRLLI